MKYNDLDINKLISVINEIRSPLGCPWDKQQTFKTFSHYLQLECNELITAINNSDNENICEEIGDVLFVLLSMASLAEENSIFTRQHVINQITEKMIFRHPHVFTDLQIENDDELQALWQKMKEEEKKKN